MLAGNRLVSGSYTAEKEARRVSALSLCRMGGASVLHIFPMVGVLVGSDKVVGLAFWSTVFFILGVFEIAARSHGRLVRRSPSIVDLIRRYLRQPVVRCVAIAVWLFAGWHLFSH